MDGKSNLGSLMLRCHTFFVSLALALLVSGIPVRADDPGYQVDLTPGGAIPKNGADAASTIRSRQRTAVQFMACGQELQFLTRVGSAADVSTGDGINTALAKMYWFAGMPDRSGKTLFADTVTPCHQEITVSDGTVPVADPGPPNFPKIAADVNARFARTFGDACKSVLTTLSLTADAHPLFHVTYDVSPDCLSAEFNYAIQEVYVTGQMGSGKGMPCHVFGKLADSEGNWDFSMRSLIRVLYLDSLYTQLHPSQRQIKALLTTKNRNHIREDLITTSIDLGPPSYPITGCGNTDHAAGDATSRVDDGGFFDNVGDDLGNARDWLLKHWYISYPLLGPVVAGADAVVVAVVEAAAAANVAIQESEIPETENHRLMIESTRYLNNQLLRADLSGDSSRLGTLASSQKNVHDWLLQRLQSILKDDFIEYNARPYQREAIGAIMNLNDFAQDDDVATAAHLVLEYATAKFAVGSNQSRRLPPFRRHMSDIANFIDKGQNILVTGQEADHQVALSLIYSGQTQQMGGGKVSNEIPPEAAFGAFTWYLPHKFVLDLAIDKSTPYLQRFRSGGIEIYSSGKGFSITAGGLRTDYAYTVLGMGDAEDMGAALPTTIMFPSGTGISSMQQFLRFDGLSSKVQGSYPPTDPQTTYDHNASVTRGFACGINIQIPADMSANGCLHPGPANREPYWFFFNSKQCPGYAAGPPVYLVLYNRPCLAAAVNCKSFGFLEAVDVAADTPAAFQAFVNGVLARNAPNLVATPPVVVAGGGGMNDAVALPSTYITSDGRKIDFDPTEHIRNGDRTGLKAVNGVAETEWKKMPLADGDLIQKNDWPLVTITNPRFPGQAVTLDFRGWGVPKYDAPQN